MKKQILFALLTACIGLINYLADAQCTPWCTGGNTIGAGSNIFGTLDANDILINGDGYQIGIATGNHTSGNYGNFEIGIAGTLPQNKLLVENGAISTAPTTCSGPAGPYVDLCQIAPIMPSDVGIYSYSNNQTSGSYNVGVVAATDASQAIGIGYVALVSNATNNLGMFLNINGSTSGASNTGLTGNIAGNSDNNTGIQLSVDGTSATNIGMTASVDGDNGNNTGMQVNVDGNSGNNLGANIAVGGASTTTNTNAGASVNVTGSSVENDGIDISASGSTSDANIGVNSNTFGSTYSNYANPQGNIALAGSANSGGVTNSVNTAVKGDANGDESFNSSFYGNSSGNDGAINIGIQEGTIGNNNNSWSGPSSTSPAGWQANVGMLSGVYGENSVNIGGMAQVGTDNAGSQAYALIGSSAAQSGLSQVGVWGYLTNSPSTSTINYGVDGDLSNLTAAGLASGAVYYAVYGIAPSGTAGTNPGYLVSGTNSYSAYAGYFDGDVFTSGVYYYSDAKLKENITEFTGALGKLSQLDVKNYTFNQSKFPVANFPQGQQIGLLAEDLKKVFPTLVKHTIQPAIKGKGDAVDFEAVNYDALIPVLVAAVNELDAKTDSITTTASPIVQQQQAQIETLTSEVNEQNRQIASLTSMLNDICNLGCPGLQNSGGNNQDVVLYQSIPNPTSGNATIGYVINIPFTTASIIVSTTDGNTVKEFKITQAGKGNVVFEGNAFASGTFRYSLYIDNKLYDTKTIVMTKN